MEGRWWASVAVSTILLLALFFIAFEGDLNYGEQGLGIDFRDSFYPAAVNITQGESPYTIPTVFSGPWTFPFLLPFVIVPWQVGYAISVLLTVITVTAAVRAVGGRPYAAPLVLINPYTLGAIVTGNLEWLTLLAIWAPAPIGILLAMVKPQLGIGLVAYNLATLRRHPPVKRIIYGLLCGAAMAWVASYFLFSGRVAGASGLDWNRALFPYAIPLGLLLAALAFFGRRARGRLRAGLSAGPYLSPYVGASSFVGVLIALSSSRFWPLLYVFIWILSTVVILLR